MVQLLLLLFSSYIFFYLDIETEQIEKYLDDIEAWRMSDSIHVATEAMSNKNGMR